jgi:ferric-dicitrate binding protein FerR (iron transport regulator)
MKPNTTIILSSPIKKQSKIALLAGNIWANVKKMLKDGTMDIEMSQGVAGIKGTIFVCEENGGSSTLKVIEGDVQFTDKTTGRTTPVTSGNMITAGEEAVPLSDFNILKEYAGWTKYDSNLTITNKTNTNNNWILIFVGIGSIVITGAVIVFLNSRKNHKALRH